MYDSFAQRLWTYQAERFPLASHAVLMGVAVFAAVAVPAASGGLSRFPWGVWAVGVLTLLVYFFFLRVMEEHKEPPTGAGDDPGLAAVGGLVTLAELRRVVVISVLVAIVVNAVVEPGLLVLLALALGWAGLNGREFFARDWLRERPAVDLVLRTVALPLIFLYATGLVWVLAKSAPPAGTGAILGLSFMNGLVIEIGQNIRAPEREREIDYTYSGDWGLGRAMGIWVAVVVGGAMAAMAAAAAAGDAVIAPAVLAVAGIGVLVVAGRMVASPTYARSRWIEPTSALWVLISYAATGIGAYLQITG